MVLLGFFLAFSLGLFGYSGRLSLKQAWGRGQAASLVLVLAVEVPVSVALRLCMGSGWVSAEPRSGFLSFFLSFSVVLPCSKCSLFHLLPGFACARLLVAVAEKRRWGPLLCLLALAWLGFFLGLCWRIS